jgi:hypothetical protein
VRCIRDWKTGGYGHHQRTWLQKSLHKLGAKNSHHQKQNGQKNICAERFQLGEKDEDASL